MILRLVQLNLNKIQNLSLSLIILVIILINK
jgi:hypothetical protein